MKQTRKWIRKRNWAVLVALGFIYVACVVVFIANTRLVVSSAGGCFPRCKSVAGL